MSSVNNEEILITFDELKQLEIEDIALCIDKYQALSICEKSSALAPDIYHLWVNKMFKAYDLLEYQYKDWLRILGFLEDILNKFIQSCPDSNDDLASKQLNRWWLDTVELLQWLQTIVDKLDKRIFALILAFILEIIIKTCKKANKSNMQPILNIQKQLLQLLSSHIFNMELDNVDDFRSLNKVLTSLCDVGSAISSSDIKLSIETWRVVTKISTKCTESYNGIDMASKEAINEMKRNWTERPVMAVLKELHKLFTYFLEDETALNNGNFWKVAQFYVKLVKIVIKNTSTFPAIKEYMEVYTIFMHQLCNKTSSQHFDSTQHDLNEILSFIHHEAATQQYLCQHLSKDNQEFISCNLILEYMRISCSKDKNQDVNLSNRIFGILFDGPLIFIDGEKFPKLLMWYATLTVKDVTGQLHMLWCKKVLESSWIRAYVSCAILKTYYGYIFKLSHENVRICLEFWTKCWEKCNASSCMTTVFNHRKFLAEMILKSIISQLPKNLVDQCFDKHTNSEIILLKCGKSHDRLLCILNEKLISSYKKICDMNLVREEYTELLNLMDIWCCNPHYVNIPAVKNEFTEAFHKIFSLSMEELVKFKDFLSKSFCIFKILTDKQIDKRILKCLEENLNKTKTVVGAFMLEYLLRQMPQSEQLLKALQTPEVIKLQRFLANTETLPVDTKSESFKIFKDRYNKSLNKSNQFVSHDVPTNKRPRIGDTTGDSKSYKYVLTEMFETSQQILKSTTTTIFDSEDYDLLNGIKHNIEQCLLK